MAGAGFAGMVGDIGRFNYMAKNLIARTREDLEKSLERSAKECEGTMKRGILRKEFGLHPNTSLTIALKGGNIPLVASNQLVQNITTSELGKEQSEKISAVLIGRKRPGLDSESKAFFVGVKRMAPMKEPDSYRMGTFKAIPLFNIAKKMVKKHTIKLPKSGLEVHVPARDFVTPAKEAHKARNDELMIGSVTKTLRTF